MKITGIGPAVLMATLGVLAIGLAGMDVAQAARTSVTAIPPRRAAVKPLSPQQVRARRCAREAYTRRLNGAARQNFVRACLKQPLAATTAVKASRPTTAPGPTAKSVRPVAPAARTQTPHPASAAMTPAVRPATAQPQSR